jgi:hypothetical protein
MSVRCIDASFLMYANHRPLIRMRTMPDGTGALPEMLLKAGDVPHDTESRKHWHCVTQGHDAKDGIAVYVVVEFKHYREYRDGSVYSDAARKESAKKGKFVLFDRVLAETLHHDANPHHIMIHSTLLPVINANYHFLLPHELVKVLHAQVLDEKQVFLTRHPGGWHALPEVSNVDSRIQNEGDGLCIRLTERSEKFPQATIARIVFMHDDQVTHHYTQNDKWFSLDPTDLMQAYQSNKIGHGAFQFLMSITKAIKERNIVKATPSSSPPPLLTIDTAKPRRGRGM